MCIRDRRNVVWANKITSLKREHQYHSGSQNKFPHDISVTFSPSIMQPAIMVLNVYSVEVRNIPLPSTKFKTEIFVSDCVRSVLNCAAKSLVLCSLSGPTRKKRWGNGCCSNVPTSSFEVRVENGRRIDSIRFVLNYAEILKFCVTLPFTSNRSESWAPFSPLKVSLQKYSKLILLVFRWVAP